MRRPTAARVVALRRVVGVTFCSVGGAMLSYSAARYVAGIYRADAAERGWEEQEARRQISSARAFAVRQSPSEETGLGGVVGRLVIPRIGVDEVVLEGVEDEELDAAPGHLPGSALPGRAGNAVISAHRDRHFARLGELNAGDTIHTETARSNESWVVVGRRIVSGTTPALFATAEPTLTLTTCWPIRYVGAAPDRLIVTARLVTPRAPKSDRRERSGS